MTDFPNITFQASSATLRYAILYAEPRPRWWWCRYLPRSWGWAWKGGPIAFVDLTADHPAEGDA